MTQSKLHIWLLAARPKTLPAAAAPVIIGTAMAFASGGFHLLSALAALLGALFIQVGTNFANDYFDYKKGVDQPDRLGPTRVTQSGMVSSSQIKTATTIAFGIAFFIGIYLVFQGGWPIVIIGLCSILFGVLYTGGPLPIGYIGLGDLFVLIFFGPVAVGGTYYVQTLTITPEVIIAGIAPGLFSTAILTVNNLRDVKQDRLSGKKTLAIRFGVTFSRLEYIGCIVIATLIPVILFFWYQAPRYSLISLVVLLIAAPSLKKIYKQEGRQLNDLLASTGRLLFLFAILFSIGYVL